jgi:hypothetical protein
LNLGFDIAIINEYRALAIWRFNQDILSSGFDGGKMLRSHDSHPEKEIDQDDCQPAHLCLFPLKLHNCDEVKKSKTKLNL